jgi:hypothetical protein
LFYHFVDVNEMVFKKMELTKLGNIISKLQTFQLN